MITQSELKEILHYDPNNGIFTRLKTGGGVKAGSVAGTFDKDGYVVIRVKGKIYKSHRLAWLYVHGAWPTDKIDHKDGNPSNNRIYNLREATNAENNQNRRRANKGSTSKYLGISWNKEKSKWQAEIQINGKSKFLGCFEDEICAFNAYLEAKLKYHPFQTLS